MSSPPDSSASSGSSAAAAGFKRVRPDAAEEERRVQPRRLHSESNPTAAASSHSDAQTAAAALEPAPAARLYCHALESIFAFLDLRGLAVALQVSRGWLGAAKSMGGAQLSVSKPAVPLCAIAASAMGRHVAAIGGVGHWVALSADSLYILALRMAQVRRLMCSLSPSLLTAGAALAFPAALRLLHFELPSSAAAVDVNAVLRAAGCLPLLKELTVHLIRWDPQNSFAPLVALPRLRALVIHWSVTHADLSDAQVAELRSMPQLRKLIVGRMTNGALRRLLQPPHDLQWRQVALPRPLDDEAAALLPQLPSLTKLANVQTRCARFEWLRGLPRLTHVALEQHPHTAAAAGSLESLLTELQRCTHITHLSLCRYSELTAAHLAQLLPRLPRLRELELDELTIDSLSFLAQAPMTSQLTKLALENCQLLSLTELRHVHTLRALQTLWLSESFDERMDSHCQSFYTPPSHFLPQLRAFTYTAPELEVLEDESDDDF